MSADTPCKADLLAETPTKAVTAAASKLVPLAESGGSEAVQQIDQADGSVLLIRVRAGEDPVYEAVPPPIVEGASS